MKISNLPEDLVVEILSRVPAVSLARLRSTSKEWNGLIKNGRLAKKHYANAPRHSFLALVLIEYRLYLMSFNLHGVHNNVAPSGLFTLKDPVSNSSLNEVDIRDVFHCEGLLLCTTKENRLVVWNPCSGETRWIQPRHSYKESDLFSLGYDNKSSRYKILRMDRFCVQTEYEVYDFTSNSWRVVVGKTRDWFIRDGYTHGVFVNGNTYWLATTQNFENEDEYEYESLLLSFDFSTEIFGSVSLPGNLFTIPLALSVTRQTQQLCMLLNDIFMSNVYYIRIATKSESTGAMSWNKFLTVSEDDLRYRFQFKTGVSYLAGQEKENKVVVSCNRPSRVSKNIMHIMGENEYIELDHHGAKPSNESPTPLFLSYVPSLVQIQQGI